MKLVEPEILLCCQKPYWAPEAAQLANKKSINSRQGLLILGQSFCKKWG